MLCVFTAGLSHFSVALSRVFTILCCLSLDLGWGEPVSEVLSVFRASSKKLFCCLSCLGVMVWRKKAGKGPYPVSLLVPPWQFLREVCGNSCLFSSQNETTTVVPDTSLEHSREKSLCSPCFSSPVC